MKEWKFNNGDKVKDIVTGFTGIVIARTEFRNGCSRYMIQPIKLDKDGLPGKEQHLDENDIALICYSYYCFKD